MSDHTPRPWEALLTSDGGAYVGPAPASVGGAIIMVGGDNRAADARLAAAAPEMYAALKEHLRLWGADQDMPSFNEAIERAQAAIAKAEGR